MSEAPERICLLPDYEWSWMDGSSPYETNAIEYTRTDLIQPMIDKAVAEALELAARVAFDFGCETMLPERKPYRIAAAIRAMKPEKRK